MNKILKIFSQQPYCFINLFCNIVIKFDKMKINPVVVIALILVGLFASFWAFNHIDAWIGILMSVVILGLAINYLVKQLKKL